MTLKVKNTEKQKVHFTYYTPLHWIKFLKLSDERKVTKQNSLLLKPGNATARKNVYSSCKMMQSLNGNKSCFSFFLPALFSGDSYEVQVHFLCDFVGVFPATLAFEFELDNQDASTTFHIVRFIEAHCITSLGMELAPVAPFKPRSLPAWTPEVNCAIVNGQLPEGYDHFILELFKRNFELYRKRVFFFSGLRLLYCRHGELTLNFDTLKYLLFKYTINYVFK